VGRDGIISIMTFSVADLPAVESSGEDGSGEGPRADSPRRRVFSPEYKHAVLEEYERLTEPGAKGALLRREGLYSSHLIEWRRARDAGALAGMAARPSRRSGKTPEQRENERLAAENAWLAAELARTKAALEVVGKAHALLELLSESADPPTGPTGPAGPSGLSGSSR
jgi:transposase-like protein